MTSLVKVSIDTQDLEVSLNYANERNSAQDDSITELQSSVAALEDELHGVTPTSNVDVALANLAAGVSDLQAALTGLAAIVSTNTDSLLAVEGRIAALEEASPAPVYDDTALKNRLKVLEGIMAALVPYDDSGLKTRLTTDENVTAATKLSVTAVATRVTNAETRLTADEGRISKLEGGTNPTPPTTSPFTSPFSAASLWNTPIQALGTRPNYNWGANPWTNRQTFSTGVWVAPATGGTSWQVTCTNSPSGANHVVTGTASTPLVPSPDSDGNLVWVVGDDVWSFWGCTVSGTNRCTAKLGIKASLSGTGFGPGPGVKAGTRSSGFSLLGGLITHQSIQAGAIKHAIAGALPASCLSPASPGYVSPATSADGYWQTGYSGQIRMGSRWAIPKAVACPSSDPVAKIAWTAFQVYGLIIGDADSSGLAICLERNLCTAAEEASIGSIMSAAVANFCPVTA